MNQLTESWHEGLAPAQKLNAQRVEMTNVLRNTLLHSLLAQLRICIHIRLLEIACVQTNALFRVVLCADCPDLHRHCFHACTFAVLSAAAFTSLWVRSAADGSMEAT